MAKLCYKVGGIVKKYDLKDNANKPRLAVKINGITKYLSLVQGAKSEEVNIKTSGKIYSIQTAVPYEDTGSAISLTYLHFIRAQSAADNYNWSSSADPEDNISLCNYYGYSYGDANLTAHSYGYNRWGGTGPFRMYPTKKYYSNTPASTTSFDYVVSSPFYFKWSDQSTTLVTHAHGGTTYILDVLKNGERLRNTSNVHLFSTGDIMQVILFFGGYNTQSDSGASGWSYDWYPKVKPATTLTEEDAPFGFYFRHPSGINNTTFYGNPIDWDETPSASTGGLEYKSSPVYYIAKDNYRYYPADNGMFTSDRTYWNIYNHSHGCHVYSSKFIINGTRYNWNSEFDIHVGDNVCILFNVDFNGGDNFWSWDYGIRPKLRKIVE